MKIVCSQDDLLGRLQIAARGVSQRSTVQILSGILVRAEANGPVELAATDMELSVRVTVPAQVHEPGSTVLPGRLLLEIVRALPQSEVTIEQTPGTGAVRIACGSSEYSLHAQGAEDFPHLPEASGPSFTLERQSFVATINYVARAASRDESRPVLTGILVEFGSGGDAQAIVPARALVELGRIAAALDADSIQVSIGENQILFGLEGVWLSARRIDGQFPNYRQLLPQAFEHEIPAGRSELLDVVRRTALMAQRTLPLRLAFEPGKLTISAQTQDVGEAHESIPVDFHGEPLEIGFNAEFLRDGIESVEGDTVRLKLISPLRPGLVQGEDGSFSYLIMPIRLST
jgi:DNA polymerase-3 subunit beta